MNGFGFDPLYLLLALPALLLVSYAQWRVQSTYNKYAEVPNGSGMSGFEVAKLLLNKEQLPTVGLEVTPGKLSDHYDPQGNILRLSPDIGQRASVAAMAVTAHEVGHALQDRDNYSWMKVRTGVVPLLKIGSTLGYLMFIAGLMVGSTWLAILGVLAFSGGAFFSLVTLPVELNASTRAMAMLESNGLLRNEEERKQANDMLRAAALTYVAGAAQALSSLLYFLFMALGAGSRRRSH
ncbi:MAG: zinc metallopeptidase [Ardenticatenales bacterium]|nr:zinc metallopeptidase [Ardenticatenales bacterium]